MIIFFKDAADLRSYAEIVKIEFADVAKTLKAIDEEKIKPLLGEDLFTLLLSDYAEDKATETGIDKDAYDYLREACKWISGSFFTADYAEIADVALSSDGVRRNESQQMKTAYGYQKTAFREALIKRGENYTEKLLAYLDKKQFPIWKNTAAHISYNQLMIKSGSEFDKLFKSATPFKNYYAMRAKMEDIEELDILPLIGVDLYDRLKTAADLNDTEKLLLRAVKKAIAYLTVASAIPTMTVQIDQNGLSVMNIFAIPTKESLNSRGSAGPGPIETLLTSVISSARQWIERINLLQRVLKGEAELSNGKIILKKTGYNGYDACAPAQCVNGQWQIEGEFVMNFDEDSPDASLYNPRLRLCRDAGGGAYGI